MNREEQINQGRFREMEFWQEYPRDSETYKKVLAHRRNCEKWGKEFCMDCFGGGLTKFGQNLQHEVQRLKT